MNRQTRKRLATRQKISDVATGLFIRHGFDQVTMGEIAEAADVSRMTVFNHFARKEDMFFHLDQAGRDDVLTALRKKHPGIAPVEALRLFAHRAIAEERPYVRFFDNGSKRFIETVRGSEALKARARTIRDELSDVLRLALTESVQRPPLDPAACLAASMLLATWTVALNEGYRVYESNKDVEKAKKTFLNLVDQGTKGVQAAIKGTPYV
ncbi:TetR/AcrR family transcriptional regulator [Granulicella arctica]|uniref:TetR/AcrR family transcriptional regulator n=1 Tax=Granulicella arctica TaxID=940613 RepID=UPI0021DF9822|nr:TetR/AcrR family transcriptional regulator [Granulicella arctica]